MPVKLVFTLRRKPGMSREEFQHYWKTIHAPLVRGYADVGLTGIWTAVIWTLPDV
jgi:hypothetical protein